MELVRKLVYKTNEVNLEQFYNELISPRSTTASYIHKYPQLMVRLKAFWKRRSEWALSYRIAHFTRGNNTNNYMQKQVLESLKRLSLAGLRHTTLYKCSSS